MSSRPWPVMARVSTSCMKRWSGTAISRPIFLSAPWTVTPSRSINSYYVALGQPEKLELPLDPSDLDQIPQIKTQILLNLDSFNLEATPVITSTGTHWTELRAQTPQPGNVDGNELYFTFLADVQHEYPNGKNPVGFNLPDWVWPFFVQHPRP